MKREPGYYKVRGINSGWEVAQFLKDGNWHILDLRRGFIDSDFDAIGDRIPMPDDEPQKSDIGPDPEPPITLDDLQRIASALGRGCGSRIEIYGDRELRVSGIPTSGSMFETTKARLRKALEFLDEPPRRTVMEVLRGEK